jgi:hypothetical protein
MNNPKVSLQRLIIQGCLVGNLAALFASFVFAVIDGITMQINGIRLNITDTFRLDYSFLILTFAMGFAISILPASLGSTLLAILINNDNQADRLSPKIALFIGLLLGSLSGLAVCIFVGFLFFVIAWSVGKGSFTPFLIRSTEVIILSSLAGGFTALKLVDYCRKKSLPLCMIEFIEYRQGLH